ncbi:unnamed protein product [Durusdinium trenchii]|uniref:Uncharacterized protein n=2 Tax=Durusdinium trenchii TaxID=1381693 RepID=A0ABP0L6Q3_9DINO
MGGQHLSDRSLILGAMAINTRVVSEAMYGWYLLSRRGAEAGVMAKAAPVSTFYDVKQPPEEGKKVRRESDAISTDCGSEASKPPQDFGPPPGLENALDDAAPCLGNTLEELIWRGTKKDSSEIWWDWTEPLLGVSPMGTMQWTPSISLPLSSHLMGLLSSRRGKQRLRAVEQQSGAQLLLDLHWQAIHISGWPKSIGKAQELLDVMEGFVVEVSHAMWAELMRCRSEETATDDLPLTLSKLQELLGYRVHVERDALALRIFGPKHEALNAQKVLQRLEELCSSEILKLPDDCVLWPGVSRQGFPRSLTTPGRRRIPGVGGPSICCGESQGGEGSSSHGPARG